MLTCRHDRLHLRGCFFFTVNLADPRLRLLTEHIEELRTSFRETQKAHPFTIEAMVVLPDHLHAVWTMPGLVTSVRDWPHSSFHRMVRLGVLPEDWAGDVAAQDDWFGERPEERAAR